MNVFDNENLKWRRFTGDDSFDYPIDYEAAFVRPVARVRKYQTGAFSPI
jgi:hypothetical protein